MEDAISSEDSALRQLEPHWNHGMIAASIAISLLGAFTSTQLMCQAKVSRDFRTVLVWTFLGSLTFGFCSIWGLHFVAMLAYELDIQVGISVPLTITSSVLAVTFTFAALAFDLLWTSYSRDKHKRHKLQGRKKRGGFRRDRASDLPDLEFPPLLDPRTDSEALSPRVPSFEVDPTDDYQRNHAVQIFSADRDQHDDGLSSPAFVDTDESHGPKFLHRFMQPTTGVANTVTVQEPEFPDYAESNTGLTASSEHSTSQWSSSLFGTSSNHSFWLSGIRNLASRSTSPAKSLVAVTCEALYQGCTRKNIAKGFLWSLAITSMHYVGIEALVIPRGYCTLNYGLVILSALISWIVCVVGCILMASMETRLGQQFLFSVSATSGVAGMHYTGMRAATFYSESPPSELRGYPPALATAIVSIAIATCLMANGLLAHAATVSRNKLAEIVLTRKRLWRTIAEKEHAEAAAAARSDFIASASHEIRTPLHHLQGYGDLLSQTPLTEEGRSLLAAIQRATKTLSLITNNVLDWSKLEKDAETVCRPVALDIRTVCESILVLLPNKDDEQEVEILMVVQPNVPTSIYLDETYIHRILMNLLSNALKFTRSGYILLSVEIEDGNIRASVKDTGPGVPQSFLPQLYEPFKQAQTRGSQRGTGLGLSIVKQLLRNMKGNIQVESKHPETDHVDWHESGSTFTITIPVQTGLAGNTSNDHVNERVAILHDGEGRSLEGLKLAWEKFGYAVTTAREFRSLPSCDWRYIWTDVAFLKKNPSCLQALLKPAGWLVLIPYDTLKSAYQVPGLETASHCILLPKPLIWHQFSQRIASARAERDKSEVARMVRFSSRIDFVDQQDVEESKPTEKIPLVLLVEDNPINQKLGRKMLSSLRCDVKVAENGQEAVDMIKEHDLTVDVILMDQSMPCKDGVTATTEIRALEAAGILVRRHPIIAVTAVVNSQAQALFKAAGADDFLAKPLSLAKLRQALSVFLPET